MALPRHAICRAFQNHLPSSNTRSFTFRRFFLQLLEAIILGLVAAIGLGFAIELWLVKPDWPSVAQGMLPSWQTLTHRESVYLAIGILGATVMPHNLYLHSSIVQTRVVKRDDASKREAISLSRIDTLGTLMLALLVNAAILILARTAFHLAGHGDVTEIGQTFALI